MQPHQALDDMKFSSWVQISWREVPMEIPEVMEGTTGIELSDGVSDGREGPWIRGMPAKGSYSYKAWPAQEEKSTKLIQSERLKEFSPVLMHPDVADWTTDKFR
jgi:hypothetical protein